MEAISILASDHYPIAAHIFESDCDKGRALLINSATGVRQQLYFGLASWLAGLGYVVVTYDYRGIGLSKPAEMRHFDGSMRSWGTRDFTAVTGYIKERYPNHEKYCLGHSVGALIMGMNPDSTMFRKLIFIATQDAYIGYLNWPIKLMALFGFGVAQPVSTSLLGHFPANRFGLGESLPAGAASDWRILILNPHSTGALLNKVDSCAERLQQPTLVINADDDRWVTKSGMRSLLQRHYKNLKPTFKTVRRQDSPRGHVGHINFFRKYNQPLWTIIPEWMEA